MDPGCRGHAKHVDRDRTGSISQFGASARRGPHHQMKRLTARGSFLSERRYAGSCVCRLLCGCGRYILHIGACGVCTGSRCLSMSGKLRQKMHGPCREPVGFLVHNFGFMAVFFAAVGFWKEGLSHEHKGTAMGTPNQATPRKKQEYNRNILTQVGKFRSCCYYVLEVPC